MELILLILILLAGFYMAWNIGANDVSNAMGTSVGSGALTLGKAVVIAGVLEFCGAFFLGSNVSQTVQSGIVNPEVFASDQRALMFGMLSALLSTAIWLQVASYFGWPVSTTHAIIGAILGFGAVVGGFDAVHWGEVGRIASSWVISPALSALFAYIVFSVLQRQILFAMDPIKATRTLIPFMVAAMIITFILSVFVTGLGDFHLKTSQITAITALLALSGYLIAFFILRASKLDKGMTTNTSQHVYSLNKALKHLNRVKMTATGEKRKELAKVHEEVKVLLNDARETSNFYVRSTDYHIVEKMFAVLQIFSASYVAFAHGANDVANAIGPVAAALDILKNGSLSPESSIPTWLLAMGGAGIVIGLATWGWRVMETIGKKITALTPTRGFSAEFGAAITILLASKLGLPISTTHCIVGAVLGVGLAKGISALNLRTLRDIVLSWVVTIPSSAIVCILLYYLLKVIF